MWDLAYSIFKDIIALFLRFRPNKWAEEEKLVTLRWLTESGKEAELKAQGFKLYWSSRENVEGHKLKGYNVIKDPDKKTRKMYIYITGDLILMGKKNA